VIPTHSSQNAETMGKKLAKLAAKDRETSAKTVPIMRKKKPPMIEQVVNG
jgi:hypothetical protein